MIRLGEYMNAPWASRHVTVLSAAERTKSPRAVAFRGLTPRFPAPERKKRSPRGLLLRACQRMLLLATVLESNANCFWNLT
jgi:hypothetical protein